MSLSLFNRRSFLSFGAAGVASLFGCAGSGARRDVSGSFDGEVIVIGAGPAGMSAAHLLRLNNVQYTVLEASGAVGGRIQHAGCID